ncbi:MAG: hypothetical protein IPL87_01555 [Candidatus Moraniibacteriota bacterium]|nr:MAG: hypothetical protein IPL87_01555 [Candidatus Moranbacteria bacterium]
MNAYTQKIVRLRVDLVKVPGEESSLLVIFVPRDAPSLRERSILSFKFFLYDPKCHDYRTKRLPFDFFSHHITSIGSRLFDAFSFTRGEWSADLGYAELPQNYPQRRIIASAIPCPRDERYVQLTVLF